MIGDKCAGNAVAQIADQSIDVADHLINSEGLLPESIFDGAKDMKNGQFRLASLTMESSRRKLLALFSQGNLQSTEGLASNSVFALRRSILDVLAVVTEHCWHESASQAVASSPQAYRLVNRARDLLDTQLRSNPSIEFVAHELGVTTPTLHRSFRSVLGISPKQYFMVRKLDEAHRILSRGGLDTRIDDIAHELGFVSSSRFAEQYRRQYGHRPSTTKRIFVP